MSSIRWSATLAHSLVSASTTIWFTTSPATRFSSTHARCGRVDAEHRRARADRAGRARRPSCRGARVASRCTMWISVPTPSTEPGAASCDQSWMRSVEPTRSASSHDLVRALGVHDDLDAGVLGAERLDVLGPEALVHRAVALPEQERRVLDVALLEPAELEARVPHPHVVVGRSPSRSRCCGRGAGRGRTAPCRRAANAHSSTARAFDDVHTAPPLRPTNAFSAADEFM